MLHIKFVKYFFSDQKNSEDFVDLWSHSVFLDYGGPISYDYDIVFIKKYALFNLEISNNRL